jgi:hypothetical protein
VRNEGSVFQNEIMTLRIHSGQFETSTVIAFDLLTSNIVEVLLTSNIIEVFFVPWIIHMCDMVTVVGKGNLTFDPEFDREHLPPMSSPYTLDGKGNILELGNHISTLYPVHLTF